MRIKRLTGAAVAVALLAVPSAAQAGTRTYAGDSDGAGHVALDARFKDGKPKRITALRAYIPINCEISGPGSAEFSLPVDIKVNGKGKFWFTFVQPTYGNVSKLKGKFDRKTLAGSFDFNFHYLADATFPEESCSSGVLAYSATKGAPDETANPPGRRSWR